MPGEDARVASGPPYELPYEVVDVFTETAYAGNPLAVVLDADGLSTGQLQAIAGEFNLSETAFPLSSGRADYRLRIFTPHIELPFAGHPSVGAAHTLARLGRIRSGAVVQDCGAGLLPVDVDPAGATLTGGQPEVGPSLDAAVLLAAVGLGVGDLDPAAAPGVAGCGDLLRLPAGAGRGAGPRDPGPGVRVRPHVPSGVRPHVLSSRHVEFR